MLTRKPFFYTVIALLIFISTGCTSEKEEQQKLFNEVIAVHDEVMPKMDQLRSLAKKLSSQADSLALDSIADRTAKIDELRQLSKNLKDANEGMMEWMRQFEQQDEGTPHGEVIQYLSEQRKQIQKVRDDMLNSKEEAEKYLLPKD
ncbi:MAG: hypothetical protein ABJF11_01305 [Reichenbachiella sp.]|uniref:hypothetical protein n=1 Tax=Reichenbachiella sp. TaxID=2184521 RepID=UPI003267E7D8